MVLKASQERVKTLLKDTITLLCKNGLEFQDNFTVEAVIGITLDNSDVFLISMNEIVKSEKLAQQALLEDVGSPQSADTTTERQVSPKAIQVGKRKWNSESVKVKEEPCNEEESGDGFNPQAEDLWPGGEPPSLSPSGLEDGSGSLHMDRDETAPPSSKKAKDSNHDSQLNIKLEHRDKDDDSDEDLVFVKQEASDFQSCAQVKSPASSSTSQNFRQGYARSMSVSSDVSLSSMGMNDSSMAWSQSPQHFQSQQQPQHPQQQQQPQLSPSQQQHTNYPLRMSRTSTITSDMSEQSQFQGDPQGSMQGQQQAKKTLHICSICQKVCRNRTTLREHEAWHRGQYVYHCQQCGKGFMSTSHLRGHMSWHTGIKEFKCQLCDKEFRYKSQLKDHMNSIHGTPVIT